MIEINNTPFQQHKHVFQSQKRLQKLDRNGSFVDFWCTYSRDLARLISGHGKSQNDDVWLTFLGNFF